MIADAVRLMSPSSLPLAMVDTSFFTALVSPSGLISLIALVIAAVAFAGYLKGTREANLRNPEARAAYQVLGPEPVYPAAPWGAAYGAPPYVPPSAPVARTVAVSLVNASAADENVQLLLDGEPAGTLAVPAGKTAQASLHTTMTSPQGATVRVEAVTADGRRAVQDVSVGGPETAAVVLRIC